MHMCVGACVGAYAYVWVHIHVVPSDLSYYSHAMMHNSCHCELLRSNVFLGTPLQFSTRIAQPPSSWMDTYLQWIPPTGQCCGYDNDTLNECYQPGECFVRTCMCMAPPTHMYVHGPTSGGGGGLIGMLPYVFVHIPTHPECKKVLSAYLRFHVPAHLIQEMEAV